MPQRFDWISHQFFDIKKQMMIVLDTALPNKQQNKAAKDMVDSYLHQAEQNLSVAYISQQRMLREMSELSGS